MKTGDHTPGPWKWSAPMPDYLPDYLRITADGRTIATLPADEVTFDDFEVVSQEGYANARLIAEAPEMLEILHLALAFLDVHKSPLAGRARALFDRLRDRT